jgi:hypothetical protein
MATFDELNARQGVEVYTWIDIEGIRDRFGHYLPSWNPSPGDKQRTINQLLADVPRIGGQMADPLNGGCSIPSHEFNLLDVDGEITRLISVSDTPFVRSFLTAGISKDDTEVPVEDLTDFPSTGDVYLDRETIYYGGTDTDSKLSQTASAGLTGETATAGDRFLISDASRTEDQDGPGNYWAGSRITFTSGPNTGESRIIRSSYYDDESSRGYLSVDSAFPNAVSLGDTYSITLPPNRLRCSGLTEADDYWKGAVIEIVAGLNVGEVRWIQSFTAATDELELVTPLPTYCDATTQFNIILRRLTSCERGMYGSEAVEHKLTDDNGALVTRQISNKVPFLKTRMVKIFENRVGAAESEAIRTVGFIDDYNLDPDGDRYSFRAGGLLKIVSRKIMSKGKKGNVAFKPLWGGIFQVRHTLEIESYTIGGAHGSRAYVTWWFAFALEDGTAEGFTVDKVYISTLDQFPDSGNIKIDDEVIHYIKKTIGFPFSGEIVPALVFTEIKATIDGTEGTLFSTDREAGGYAAYENRGLFGDKLGLENIKRDYVLSESSQDLVDRNPALILPEPLEVKALIAEHAIDSEIIQVCLCDGTEKSDFPRYDLIEYYGISGGSFAAGDTITGASSGVDAVVAEVVEDGTSGRLLLLHADPKEDNFQKLETISVGGVTATVDFYYKEIRPRNNVLDVFLQLLTSSGTFLQNGPYDTLPEGFGLGLDSDLIDFDGITELRDKFFATIPVEFVLYEPISGLEFFEDNIFRPIQTFPFETYEGKISLAALMTDAEARIINEKDPVLSLDGNHIEAYALPDWTSGKPPMARVKIKYNKKPTSDDFTSKVELIFGSAREWYKDLGRNIELEIGTFYYPDRDLLQLSHKDPKLPPLLRRLTAVVWDRQALYPCPVIATRIPNYQDIKINVGDVLLLTHAALPNLRTSQRGLDSEFFQVIGRAPGTVDGNLRLTLWQVGVHDNKYARRAPSAVVNSYSADTPSAGKSTVTFYSNRFTKWDITKQKRDVDSFVVGQSVTFLDDAYFPLGAYQYAIIESIATNTMVLDRNLVPPPSDGNLCEFALFDDCVSGQQEGRVFMADEDRLIGAGDDSAYKYL